MIRVVSLCALLAGCGRESSETTTAPSVPISAPTTSASSVAPPDRHEHECAALLERAKTIDERSTSFGVANKADGGTLVDLWRGFARLADADARVAPSSTDAAASRWEQRLIDVRKRSAPAFTALADAIAVHDAAAEKRASDALKELGTEWKDLKAKLTAGCP